jgi:hypothetical protein
LHHFIGEGCPADKGILAIAASSFAKREPSTGGLPPSSLLRLFSEQFRFLGLILRICHGAGIPGCFEICQLLSQSGVVAFSFGATAEGQADASIQEQHGRKSKHGNDKFFHGILFSVVLEWFNTTSRIRTDPRQLALSAAQFGRTTGFCIH